MKLYFGSPIYLTSVVNKSCSLKQTRTRTHINRLSFILLLVWLLCVLGWAGWLFQDDKSSSDSAASGLQPAKWQTARRQDQKQNTSARRTTQLIRKVVPRGSDSKRLSQCSERAIKLTKYQHSVGIFRGKRAGGRPQKGHSSEATEKARAR